MIFRIDNDTTVIDLDGGLIEVTRPTVGGGIASHIIDSEYSAFNVAHWLKERAARTAPLIQERFPNMVKEDREFLMTGITPAAWNKMFKSE